MHSLHKGLCILLALVTVQLWSLSRFRHPKSVLSVPLSLMRCSFILSPVSRTLIHRLSSPAFRICMLDQATSNANSSRSLGHLSLVSFHWQGNGRNCWLGNLSDQLLLHPDRHTASRKLFDPRPPPHTQGLWNSAIWEVVGCETAVQWKPYVAEHAF